MEEILIKNLLILALIFMKVPLLSFDIMDVALPLVMPIATPHDLFSP